MNAIETTAENVYNRDQLLKTYATLDANSTTAKMLLAEVNRLTNIIDINTTLAALSKGRLLADNETPFTAEQVEDVRIVTTEEVGGYTGEQFRRWHAAKDRLVESLFSATAPAKEVKPISWYRTMSTEFATWHFGFPPPATMNHAASDGGKWAFDPALSQWELREYQPAPAEPAEEETKAEPSTRQIADVIVEGRSQNMSWMQIAEMVKQVFFPTETGPWQDWPSLDAIPADVRTVWDKAGDEYRRTNGGWKFRSHGGKWQQITLPLDDYIDFAPFTTAAVAVWDPELGTRNDWTLNEGTEQ